MADTVLHHTLATLRTTAVPEHPSLSAGATDARAVSGGGWPAAPPPHRG